MRAALWLGFAILAGILVGEASPDWYFGALAFVGVMLIGAIVEHGRGANGRIRS